MIRRLTVVVVALIMGIGIGSYYVFRENFVLWNTGYYLVDDDPDHIFLAADSRAIVGQQVVDLDVRGDYIVVLRMVADSKECYDDKGGPIIVTSYSDNKEYWIIDWKRKSTIGPLTEGAFVRRLQIIGIRGVKLKVPRSYHSHMPSWENLHDCK